MSDINDFLPISNPYNFPKKKYKEGFEYYSNYKSHNNRFYGLYGPFGVGVYDNWISCQKSIPYAGPNPKYQKFHTYQEAEEWAKTGYVKYQDYMGKPKVFLPNHMPFNYMLFTKNLRLRTLATIIKK